MSFLSLKLTQKIYAGFIISGFVAISIAAISYFTTHYASEKLKEYVKFSAQSQQGFKLIQKVSELQRQSIIYTHDGHKSASEQVYEIYQSLLLQFKDMQTSDDKKINTIKRHLQQYMAAFKQLEEQRQLQNTLINKSIRTSASITETLLRDYIIEASVTHDHAMQLKVRDTLNILLLVEKNAMRYFDTLDPANIARVKDSLSQISQQLQDINNSDASSASQSYMPGIMKELAKYESNFLEAVQRTRAYMFLVNVVMAGEAYEVIYHAEMMSKKFERQKNIIETTVLGMLNQVNYIVILIIIISIFLAIFLPLKIGRSITLPIIRLSKAFNDLSTGSLNTKIPHYAINDELGELSRAAVVLKEKNRETVELLAQSESLTLELDEKTQKLERSNDELEEFVITVSHDLKSPIVTSMGFIGIIQKLAAQGKMHEVVEKLEKVVKANERMGQLINDLLELSRVNRIHLDKKLLNLSELLIVFKNMHKNQLERAGFQMQIESGLPTVYANESRILQLFENLLSNSLKYTKDQNTPIITIGSKKCDDGHLVYFKDNGPGIKKEYHNKIFKLFHRLDTKSEGTGIGLTIAAKVMKFHNGIIWVESDKGKGATFWLKFTKEQNIVPEEVL